MNPSTRLATLAFVTLAGGCVLDEPTDLEERSSHAPSPLAGRWALRADPSHTIEFTLDGSFVTSDGAAGTYRFDPAVDAVERTSGSTWLRSRYAVLEGVLSLSKMGRFYHGERAEEIVPGVGHYNGLATGSVEGGAWEALDDDVILTDDGRVTWTRSTRLLSGPPCPAWGCETSSRVLEGTYSELTREGEVATLALTFGPAGQEVEHSLYVLVGADVVSFDLWDRTPP